MSSTLFRPYYLRKLQIHATLITGLCSLVQVVDYILEEYKQLSKANTRKKKKYKRSWNKKCFVKISFRRVYLGVLYKP